MSFSDSFTWGVATAAYQIEGATSEDGRGPSVWDMFSRKPGATHAGETGDAACDHYHRYEEDVRLMADLGVNAYRFSFAWPRILPEGECDVNDKGLQFYDRLLDKLLEAKITPWGTLFHWDMPLALYHRGGWLNPDSPQWFADYARIVVDAFSDRVQDWITLNEPQCFIGLGLDLGIHAPGDTLAWPDVLRAIYNSQLAHGLAVQTIRAHARRAPRIGMAPACPVSIPASDSPEDIESARKATFAVKGRENISWWLDPVFKGALPQDGLQLFGKDAPTYSEEDLATMNQALDFFAANIYHGRVVQAGEDGEPVQVARASGAPITASKWPVTPESLYWGAKFYHERYGLPIVITENGLSNQDWLFLDGHVHDPQRIDFLHRHLNELKAAAEEGVPVEGYFHWSLLDNFEWAEGYRERFGLVYVDYETQRRVPKDSFYWYRDMIRSNGRSL